MIGRVVKYTVLAVVGMLALSLLLGAVLGQPAGLAYVETDSMEPTLNAGDGFVAVPAAIAGGVEEGDVVTYRAEELHGGDLTTHRIVDERDAGYVTKGDANYVTDQDEGEPPVTEGQIVAVALQIDGEVVRIPHLGTAIVMMQETLDRVQWTLAGLLGTTAVLGTAGLGYLLFGLGLLILVAGTILDRGRRSRTDRSRSRSRKGVFSTRLVVGAVVVFLILSSVVGMSLAGGTETYGIISAEYDAERADIIEQGTTDTQPYTLANAGVLPMVAVLEPTSDGIAVEPRKYYIEPGEEPEATLALTAPPETGYYLRSVTEYRYFAVLPPSMIISLHAIHPWLATAAVTAVIVLAFTVPMVLLLNTNGRVRVRNRKRGSVFSDKP